MSRSRLEFTDGAPVTLSLNAVRDFDGVRILPLCPLFPLCPWWCGRLTMTIDQWLQAAQADAERRGLPALKPLLDALARTTKALRAADFNERADGADAPPKP